MVEQSINDQESKKKLNLPWKDILPVFPLWRYLAYSPTLAGITTVLALYGGWSVYDREPRNIILSNDGSEELLQISSRNREISYSRIKTDPMTKNKIGIYKIQALGERYLLVSGDNEVELSRAIKDIGQKCQVKQSFEITYSGTGIKERICVVEDNSCLGKP